MMLGAGMTDKGVVRVTSAWVDGSSFEVATADEVANDVAWTNLTRIAAGDGGLRTTVGLSASFPYSELLLSYNYNNGFNALGLPADARNFELEVEYVSVLGSAGGGTFERVELQRSSTTTPSGGTGNNVAAGRAVPGSAASVVFKGDYAYWGVSLASFNRNFFVAGSTNLGIVCRVNSNGATNTIGIEAVRQRLIYDTNRS